MFSASSFLMAGCAPPVAHTDQPELLLMTSLPLRFGETTMKERLQGGGAPAVVYGRLEKRFAIRSLDDLNRLDGKPGAILLLAQPRAFAPTELVALDNWLRGGGRALILADPALRWPSDYQIGDPRRPLFTSLLSPLFTHWGIELVQPMDQSTKRVDLTVDGRAIETVTPGAFVNLQGADTPAANCHAMGMVARCTIGGGQAILLADADLLHERFWSRDGPLGLAGDRRANIELIESMLATLSK